MTIAKILTEICSKTLRDETQKDVERRSASREQKQVVFNKSGHERVAWGNIPSGPGPIVVQLDREGENLVVRFQ